MSDRLRLLVKAENKKFLVISRKTLLIKELAEKIEKNYFSLYHKETKIKHLTLMNYLVPEHYHVGDALADSDHLHAVTYNSSVKATRPPKKTRPKEYVVPADEPQKRIKLPSSDSSQDSDSSLFC